MILSVIATVVAVAAVGVAVSAELVARWRRRRRLGAALAIPTDRVAGDQQELGPGFLTAYAAGRRHVRDNRSRGSLSTMLVQARIPLRVEEVIAVTVGLTAVISGVVFIVIESAGIATVVAGAVPIVTFVGIRRRIASRRRMLREQLPEALSMLSSSMRSGHTLHRSMEALSLNGQPPLRDEFGQVIAETHLGTPVVEAVSNMADRLDLPEGVWLARAMSIHFDVGGRLADLLDTLSDLTYSRQELKREISALTAEGRISALVLGLLPVVLMLAIHLSNPNYLEPLFTGWGLAVLAGCGISIVIGVAVIRNMVDQEL